MTPAHPAGRRAGPDGTRPRHPRLFLATVGRSTTGRYALLTSQNENLRKPFRRMALIDISQRVSPATAVWPGDQEVEWTWTARLDPGESSVNLGAVRLSTHTGTHVDAPLHVDNLGGTTDDLPLDVFVGPAQVVEVGEDASSIRPTHIGQLDETAAERVLFKTPGRASAHHEWPDTLVPIHPDTIHALSDAGTRLVGTDAPSVDPLDSTDLPAHHALVDTGIVNLEGLALANVPPGRYELLALPLKIADGDAAPVRAVLRDAPLQ